MGRAFIAAEFFRAIESYCLLNRLAQHFAMSMQQNDLRLSSIAQSSSLFFLFIAKKTDDSLGA